MESLFLKVLNMSITATYVILAVFLFRLLLKRAPKKYSYLLWLVVLFRLVCPVSFPSEFSIFNTNPFDMTFAQKSSDVTLSYVPADVGYMEPPKVTVGIPILNSMVNETLPTAVPTANNNPLQIAIMIGTILWCLGIAALLLYSINHFILLKHRLSTAIRLDNHIFESDQIRTPFVLGIVKPRIYIPFGLSEQERNYILQHEAYHIRRKDHWIKPIAFFVLAVHWFNPLVWLAFASMSKDMEMSCDEKVLSEIGAGNKKEYCTSLLSFAANRRFPSAGPLAFGETSVRERVKNVLRFKSPKRWVIVCSAAACILAVAVCATNPAQKERPLKTLELYGNYSFEKKIYMNPLSSIFISDQYKQYYTLTDNSLIITEESGSQQKIAVNFERKNVNEQQFNNQFLQHFPTIVNISSYKERFQYTLTSPSDSIGYEIYLLDDEIWLAKLNRFQDDIDNKAHFWSIFKIKKLDERLPAKASIVGITDDVDTFLALNKNFKSGYDEGNAYNITPHDVSQNSGYSIFKYDKSSASFLLYKDKVYPLGEWFGGSGVTSMVIADMDKDGESELFFTYSWGSGMHRSYAAYFNPVTKQIVNMEMYINEDTLLINNHDGSLSLYIAKISNRKDFVNFDVEGIKFISDIVYKNEKIGIDLAPRATL